VGSHTSYNADARPFSAPAANAPQSHRAHSRARGVPKALVDAGCRQGARQGARRGCRDGCGDSHVRFRGHRAAQLLDVAGARGGDQGARAQKAPAGLQRARAQAASGTGPAQQSRGPAGQVAAHQRDRGGRGRGHAQGARGLCAKEPRGIHSLFGHRVPCSRGEARAGPAHRGADERVCRHSAHACRRRAGQDGQGTFLPDCAQKPR